MREAANCLQSFELYQLLTDQTQRNKDYMSRVTFHIIIDWSRSVSSYLLANLQYFKYTEPLTVDNLIWKNILLNNISKYNVLM